MRRVQIKRTELTNPGARQQQTIYIGCRQSLTRQEENHVGKYGRLKWHIAARPLDVTANGDWENHDRVYQGNAGSDQPRAKPRWEAYSIICLDMLAS